MNKKNLKLLYLNSFIISFIALIVGASFHGYRIHPENVSHYNLGVKMGILMIIIFIVFLLIGLVCLILYLKKNKTGEKNETGN